MISTERYIVIQQLTELLDKVRRGVRSEDTYADWQERIARHQAAEARRIAELRAENAHRRAAIDAAKESARTVCVCQICDIIFHSDKPARACPEHIDALRRLDNSLRQQRWRDRHAAKVA